MSSAVAQGYDELSDFYHLLWHDWRRVVVTHGEQLSSFIRNQFDEPPLTVLDCCCGIGTQAIGLALQGYEVFAADLSQRSVERAKHEAESFGINLNCRQADIRLLQDVVRGSFDVVVAWDNSLSHLLSAEDVRKAADSISAVLKPGGVFMASIRNYEILQVHKPTLPLSDVIVDDAGRRISVQLWDWAENGREYRQNYFLLWDRPEGWRTIHCGTPGRCLFRKELNDALYAAGISQVAWYINEASYNTMSCIVARKPG